MIPSEAAQAFRWQRCGQRSRWTGERRLDQSVTEAAKDSPGGSEAPSFSLEKATWRDVFAIHRLEKRCFGDDAWPWIDVLGALSSPGAIHLKLADGEGIGGYLIGERRSADIGWIAAIAIDPRWRRRGLGSQLMSAAEAELATRCVRLSLRASNQAAHSLYSKLGYRAVDNWPRYYRDGEDALVMEKVLGPGD
jgi:ribosomal-protein-alanine N-acetyltransferase